MRRVSQQAILLLLLGFVLLTPLFEVFDDTHNIQQDRDLVLLLLAAPIGLFVLTKRIVYFLPRLFRIATVPASPLNAFHDPSIEVETSPTESLALLGILRI